MYRRAFGQNMNMLRIFSGTLIMVIAIKWNGKISREGNTFGENCQNVGLHQDAAGLRMGTVNFP